MTSPVTTGFPLHDSRLVLLVWQIYGAMGVKICANGIDKAIAGTPIMVIGKDDEEEVRC